MLGTTRNKMEVLPGPLPDGRRSGGDEGLGSRLVVVPRLAVRLAPRHQEGSIFTRSFHFRGVTRRVPRFYAFSTSTAWGAPQVEMFDRKRDDTWPFCFHFPHRSVALN